MAKRDYAPGALWAGLLGSTFPFPGDGGYSRSEGGTWGELRGEPGAGLVELEEPLSLSGGAEPSVAPVDEMGEMGGVAGELWSAVDTTVSVFEGAAELVS